ncbi:MAG TPA: outer membrane beta-barrel protein, partial [Candidatus Deferrimicrobium sp.]|nr:outer membrane beta-barrel protein [Candidatus Deferrimicrobium sp.]
THNHNLEYLEIPFLFKYRLIKPKFKPYIQVGIYYSMLQSATKSLQAVSRNREYKENAIVDIKQLINRSNLGIWAGAGIELYIWGFRLQIETNYKFGLKNIVAKANRFTNEQLMFAFYDVFDDMKLRNWELTLKVLLPISFKAFRR